MGRNEMAGMSVAERIDGQHLVVKGFVLCGAAVVGIMLGAMADETSSAILSGIGTTGFVVLMLGYLVGLVVLYTKAGIWGLLGRLSLKALAYPWRVTKIIVLSWAFFYIWAAFSLILFGAVFYTALLAPWLTCLLAKRFA